MTNLPPCYAIIPARYQSHRFPGKPLAEILGKPMFQWVYEQAASCPAFQRVCLATDDDRIFKAAQERSVPVVMTSPDHPSGSDRIMEAAEIMGLEDEAVVINIQGDEPAIDAGILEALIEPFGRPDTQVTTLATSISPEEADNPDRVKVVRSREGKALYFSRAKIPHHRDPGTSEDNYLLHIGLYGYRLPVLKTFTSLPPSPLESIEKLEQLRLLEAGVAITVVLTDYQGFGVDRPEDIALILPQLKGL
ncbi:3-deoxy-manno-octulosonate cytidylyltransferase [Desulforhopalus singaporensis]|uniref:3-deoxy-manno-octulosonate cytidylyltransferase n=1 Tax=Desulforhopalus singaporensis TaxID=91360 RepID=A0A1H0RKX4_9BACT|nr:3-deoxy-manno-octulosonate cytidylyltransferase [Desulforhopalus singaporensis]SDP29646.1 3-deoxy-manno-octulosonate cytidylyltransferase (CMP-KDO synthetase) [Desulforhopalus singaporensis]